MFNFQIEPNKPNEIDASTLYDFIALGIGPASLNAGLYAKRKGLKTLLIGYELGGQIGNTFQIDNYLGFPTIKTNDLIQSMKAHIDQFEVPILMNVWIEKIEKKDDIFNITVSNGKTYQSKTVLDAMGGHPRHLGVPGEDTYAARGVSYCVACDGPFFKQKVVIVAGGGNSAIDAALDLSRTAKQVILVHRSELRADQSSIDKLAKLSNVTIHIQTQIESVIGDTFMEGIQVLDKRTGHREVIQADGLFVEIGHIPNTELVKDLVELNDKNEIIVNSRMETSLKGFYAAGDITDSPFNQIIIATSEGAIAALSATQYINQKGA